MNAKSKKLRKFPTYTAMRIFSLRVMLGMSQGEFAEKLGVTRIAALRWENGEKPPSDRNLIRMAKIAPKEQRLWFYEQAGLSGDDLAEAMSLMSGRTVVFAHGGFRIMTACTNGAMDAVARGVLEQFDLGRAN
jgi:DNA-binding XRE family transcriptional regulator